MKLSIAVTVLSAFYLQVTATPTSGSSAQPAVAQTCGYPTVPFLRAWGEAATDHFYTTNATEMAIFTASGYTSQGVAAQILPSDTQAPTAVPLFRLYSAKHTDHYYTANATNRDEVLSRGDYVSQGVAGYVYADGECGAVPLYRLSNTDIEDNFFTTDEAEVYDFVDQLGYTYVGVQAYVNPQ